jgi:acyl-CoA-binding protein
MSLTKKDKRLLNKRLDEVEQVLKYYEILENMIKNDNEGRTPRMFSWDKDDLIKWLEDNKDRNEKAKKEFIKLKNQLKKENYEN